MKRLPVAVSSMKANPPKTKYRPISSSKRNQNGFTGKARKASMPKQRSLKKGKFAANKDSKIKSQLAEVRFKTTSSG